MLFAVTFAAGYTLARSPVHARGAARSAVRAAAPTEFASEDAHLAALDAIAELPAGFRVGTSGFTFTPKEAKITATMNLTAVVLDKPTSNWAAVFTRNAFCGAPIKIGRKRLSEGKALQAILVNNKISNVCSEGSGVGDAEAVCDAAAASLGLKGGDAVLPCSTGVIGWRLPLDSMVFAMPELAESLQGDSLLPAARAIMTTDRYPKLRAQPAAGGRVCGIAKGAGMIEPNMATMLAFVLTDVAIPRGEMQRMLRAAADASFNCMSVDADQSTSDTLVCVSSNRVPLPDGEKAAAAALAEFEAALGAVCGQLAEDTARNGEGTQHVIRVDVRGAPDAELARGVGKAVVNSPLFKSAVAGNDPNVGRLVSTVGSYLGSAAPEMELERCTMKMGGALIFEKGAFRISPSVEDELYKTLSTARLSPAGDDASLPYPPHERCVEIAIDLGVGDASAVVVGSDLTKEYVSINADYRS